MGVLKVGRLKKKVTPIYHLSRGQLEIGAEAGDTDRFGPMSNFI